MSYLPRSRRKEKLRRDNLKKERRRRYNNWQTDGKQNIVILRAMDVAFPPFIIRAAKSVRVAIDELFVSL